MEIEKMDVLLVTTLADEFEALKTVTTGLREPGWIEGVWAYDLSFCFYKSKRSFNGIRGGVWLTGENEGDDDYDDRDESGFSVKEYNFRQKEDSEYKAQILRGSFDRSPGEPTLEVFAVYLPHLGHQGADDFVKAILFYYKPLFLAMSGICGGRRGDVALGDVIFADKLWEWAATDGGDDVRAERAPFSLLPAWRHNLQSFSWTQEGEDTWLHDRPELTLEQQEDWMILRLYEGEDPRVHADRAACCPDGAAVLTRLREERRWLDQWTLTEAGRERAEHLACCDLPAPQPFAVHVGGFAVGEQVVQDASLFLSLKARPKVIGLELELAAMASMARRHDIALIVAKGVVDFADVLQDGRYRRFAARASAECLLRFLRAHGPGQGRHILQLDDGLEALPEAEQLSPARLLDARYGVVPFEGQAAALAHLDAWADDVSPLRLMPVVGASGTGKTRLLAEWARQRRAQGWEAGFLRGEWSWVARHAFQNAKRLIVIIDEADAAEWLGRCLGSIAGYSFVSDEARVRLVLIMRHLDAEWSILGPHSHWVTSLIASGKPLELLARGASRAEREHVWRRAQEAFRPYCAPCTGRAPEPPDLSDPRYERPLYVHMNALVSLLDGPHESASSGPRRGDIRPGELCERVLAHELRCWLRLTKQDSLSGAARTLAQVQLQRAVTALTLRGAVADREELATLMAHALPAVDLSTWEPLWSRFVCSGPPCGVWLGGLEPALLGEHLVRGALESPEGAIDLPRIAAEADLGRMTNMFVILSRLEAEAPRVVRQSFAELLSVDPALSVLAATWACQASGGARNTSALGELIYQQLAETLDLTLASKLKLLIAHDCGIQLARVAIWSLQQIIATTKISRTKADHIDRLCYLFFILKDHNAVLEGREKKVELYRSLTRWNPRPNLHFFAASLHQLSVAQAQAKKYGEALVNAVNSTAINRFLIGQYPHLSVHPLALSLFNLGEQLFELGEHEAGLERWHEALRLYRSLAEQHPDQFVSDFAGFLYSIGLKLARSGSFEAALENTGEAVELYRSLALQTNQEFLHNLADSLDCLGCEQSDLGDVEAAVKTLSEALEIQRSLIDQESSEYLNRLARTLCNISDQYCQLGMYGDAVEKAEESVCIYRRLVASSSGCFEIYLGRSLGVLSDAQSGLHLHADAVESARESVELWRALVDQRPEEFLYDLAYSLNNLGVYQSEVGAHEAAVESAQEAVGIYRSLAEERPEDFLSDLANSLNSLSSGQAGLGARELALESIMEAVTLYRSLAEQHPEDFLSKLVSNLKDLSARQADVGEHGVARESAAEAEAIEQRLAE